MFKRTPPKPEFKLIVEDKDITQDVQDRLISLTLTDNRAFDADELSIELDDTDGLLQLPRRGAVIKLSLGWADEELVDKGTYTVDEITHQGAPDTLSIRARSADFRQTLAVLRSQSYSNISLEELCKTIAERNKLESFVAPEFAYIPIHHQDQTNESDTNFLTRICEEWGALLSIKAGKLLVLAGNNKTASGKPIPEILIQRSDGDSHSFSIADRGNYTGVRVYWLDSREPKKKNTNQTKRKRKKNPDTKIDESQMTEEEIAEEKLNKKQDSYFVGEESGDEEYQNEFVIKKTYILKDAAIRAAKAKWKQLQAGIATFSISLAYGKADLLPETPIKVSGFKKEIDEVIWTAKTITHNLSESGFTTNVELEIKSDEIDEENTVADSN